MSFSQLTSATIILKLPSPEYKMTSFRLWMHWQIGATILILFDLSADFDTIDHTLLLKILGKCMGITGTALAWFNSYLSNRTQTIVVDRELSNKQHLSCGVPQGSVLGPILFTDYTASLSNVIKEDNLQHHLCR